MSMYPLRHALSRMGGRDPLDPNRTATRRTSGSGARKAEGTPGGLESDRHERADSQKQALDSPPR
jgi:hypothetical protein